MTDLNDILYGNGIQPPPLGLITISPVDLAEYEARRHFFGRDRRRIKREVRKAVKVARCDQLQVTR